VLDNHGHFGRFSGIARLEFPLVAPDISQARVSRYMPRRGYPPTQRWRTFLRNQAFAIGAIGIGEAGRLSDVLRGWFMRVVRCATKVRDGIPCRLSSHRRPCTRCGHVALPIVQIGASPKGVACPAPPPPTPQSGTHCTWPVDDFHHIAQGHHRDASCPAFSTRSSAIARRAKRTTIPLRRLHCASATNNPKHCKKLAPKSKDLQSLSLPGDSAAIRLSRTRL
jgi:hypothetical protein